VHYFLDWLEAAKGRANETQAQDLATRRSPLAEQESARQFFVGLLSKGNAD
jgi:hypothetical protein